MKGKRKIILYIIAMLTTFLCCCGNIVDETKTDSETELIVLSTNGHIYENKLYIDYVLHSGEYAWWDGSSRYARLVLSDVDGELTILNAMELPTSWDRITQGYENFLVSGDYYKNRLWIYNLETGNTDDILMEEDKSIEAWKVKNGVLYYCVLDKNDCQGITIYARTLCDKQDELLYEDVLMTRVLFMDINDNGEIGLIYTHGTTYEHHLGVVHDRLLNEVDMQDMEMWQQNNIQHYEFQFKEDKFIICSEDVSRTLVSDYRVSSYEVSVDGEWSYVPCELNHPPFLGYVDEFYDLGSHYLAYWNKQTYREDGGKVVLCTSEGEVCREISSLFSDKVFLLRGDDMVYLLSIKGKEVENIAFEWEKIALK